MNLAAHHVVGMMDVGDLSARGGEKHLSRKGRSLVPYDALVVPVCVRQRVQLLRAVSLRRQLGSGG